MEETKVVIEWERLKNREDVFNKNSDNDCGLYQITGYHPVFGDDSLLYIGLAKDQTFDQRFRGHEKWLDKEEDVTIYLGRVESINNERDADYHDNRWRAIIGPAEELLIYFHSPPYNSKSVSRFPESNKDLRIINIGDYGDLYPEISHEGLQLADRPQRPSEDD